MYDLAGKKEKYSFFRFTRLYNGKRLCTSGIKEKYKWEYMKFTLGDESMYELITQNEADIIKYILNGTGLKEDINI